MSDQDSSSQQYRLFGGHENTATAASPCGKTYPAPSAVTRARTLLKYCDYLLALTSHVQKSGATLEFHSVRKGLLNGGCVMLNFMEYPNVVEGSLLWQILETGPVGNRFYLSPRACSGILNRAQKRGKTLPPKLEQALKQVASQENSVPMI